MTSISTNGLRRGTDSDSDLWRRLATLRIEEAGAAFTFTARLARENGWSTAFADRVMEEYRRFLFLGQVAGHPVTPSDEVDQAWHLHLTYTRSYWEDLCGDILRSPFHHGPTRGGPDEDAKFNDWYETTLDSYRAWFGTEPPADIWPSASIRFGDAPHFVRVNTRRQLVLPRPRLRPVAGRSLVVGGASVVLAGCSGVGVMSLVAQSGEVSEETTSVIVTALILAVVMIFGLVILRKMIRFLSGAGRRTGRPRGGAWVDGGHPGDRSGGCGGDSGSVGGDSGCGGGGCGGGGCGGGCGS